MEPTRHESPADPVEQLLVRSKPVPSPIYRAELERRLFDSGRSSRPRWLPAGRTALAGAVGAVGLAATFALLGLAGSGPLSSDDSDVRAKDPCRYVTTLGPTRTPYVVELADGSIEIRFRRERAERLVKRCR